MKTRLKKIQPARKPAVARKAVKPALALKADRRAIKVDETIVVDVKLSGLDEVALALEPRETFAIDLATVRRSGKVRLRGVRHGIATLVASGRLGGAEVVQRTIDIACEGRTVRILRFGYFKKS